MQDQIKCPLQGKKKPVDGSLKYFSSSVREAERENCFLGGGERDAKVDYASCFHLCAVIHFAFHVVECSRKEILGMSLWERQDDFRPHSCSAQISISQSTVTCQATDQPSFECYHILLETDLYYMVLCICCICISQTLKFGPPVFNQIPTLRRGASPSLAITTHTLTDPFAKGSTKREPSHYLLDYEASQAPSQAVCVIRTWPGPSGC